MPTYDQQFWSCLMTNIFAKAFIAAGIFVLASGAADATGFLEQAFIDAGNGVKTVAGAIVPALAPTPNTPSRPAPPTMSPCSVSPRSCDSPPKN
jgi:hypothetical protein